MTWTAAELRQARQLRRQHQTYAEIAERLREAGYCSRSPKAIASAVHIRRLDDQARAQAAALRALGWSIRKIAREIGASKSWVALRCPKEAA